MIKVLHSGFYTSIQDKGRFRFRNIGVPVSGTMDSISAGLANALLNNNDNDALLEIALNGPKLEFTKPTAIVISGAEMSPKLNTNSILNYRVYQVKKGDIISFGKLQKGLYAYLAIQGGFQSKTVLKSKSFYDGLTVRSRLQKNDSIPYKSKAIVKTLNSAIKNTNSFFETNILEVFKGPEFELFNFEEQRKLLQTKLTVTNSMNRMGYRLKESVVLHNKSMITSPVLPGTVQLTPSGHLIVLMKDAQTTGGYPRVFQLTEKSISILAQKKAGDSIKFSLL